MSTIYIGGVGKTDVRRLLEQRHDPKLKIVVSNDLEAGPILKRTTDTYYIGTCHTGAGGSLGAMLAFPGAAAMPHLWAANAHRCPRRTESFSCRHKSLWIVS